MTYSYADLIAAGSGRLDYYLFIPGIAVFGTTETAPTDSWYTDLDDDLDYHPWLVHESCGEIRDSIDYLTAEAKANQISVDVVDYDGGMIALTSSWRSQVKTYLTATLTAGATSASVEDNSDFPASGDICVGAERMTYSGKTGSTAFTGLDRTAYGTTPEEHFVDLTADTPIQPVVVQTPTGIEGRRAYLYAAAIEPESGTIGPSTCIYRGAVTARTRVGRGVYRISIKHVIDTLYSASAGNALDSATLVPGAYHSANGTELHDVDLVVYDFTTGNEIVGDQTTSFTSGWRSHEDMRRDLNVAYQEAWDDTSLGTSSRRPIITFAEGKYQLRVYGGSTYRTTLTVHRHSLEWCLGFDEGTYEVSGSGDGNVWTAQRDPVPLFVDCTDDSYTAATAIFYVDDASSTLKGSAYAFIKGNPYFSVVSEVFGLVTITVSSLDPTWKNGRKWLLVEDDDVTEVKNCLPLAPDLDDRTIKTAIQRLLGLQTSQPEPSRWCARGVLAADIDWDELDDCVGGISPALNDVRHVVTEPTVVYDAIGHHLALLGICPRVTDESKIGFVRISTPILSDAVSVALDGDQWEVTQAADVETELESAQLLQVIRVKPGLNYTLEDPDYGDPLTLTWREATTTLRSPRTIEYEIPGLVIWALHRYGMTTAEVKALLNSYAINTHFAGFGRENTTIEIPCTATVATVKCGDAIVVTHELAPDLSQGQIGLSGELGIVEARDYRHSRGRYTLTVRVGVALPTGGIAPTARATAWDEATKVMSFSSADTPEYAQTGGNDLDAFVSATTIPVLLVERDAVSPTVWSTTITTAGTDTATKTVVLDDTPMSDGDFPTAGVYMIPRTWADAWTGHQSYAYVASLSTAPLLDDDDPMVWTI